MEQLRDLLTTSSSASAAAGGLKIRENAQRGVFIEELTQVASPSESVMLELVRTGAMNRAVSSTRMNKDSSRSHTLLMVHCSRAGKQSTMFIVDLAGSELVNKTNASGKVLQEAKAINKSLSALSNVIKALGDGKKHVPFRDSKLTRVLQHALGGASATCLILAASCSSYNLAETVSTLRFGLRAKEIKNPAVVRAETSTATAPAMDDDLAMFKELYRRAVENGEAKDRLIDELQRQLAAKADENQPQPTEDEVDEEDPAVEELMAVEALMDGVVVDSSAGQPVLKRVNSSTAGSWPTLKAWLSVGEWQQPALSAEASTQTVEAPAPPELESVAALPLAVAMECCVHRQDAEALSRQIVELKLQLHYLSETARQSLDGEHYAVVMANAALKARVEELEFQGNLGRVTCSQLELKLRACETRLGNQETHIACLQNSLHEYQALFKQQIVMSTEKCRLLADELDFYKKLSKGATAPTAFPVYARRASLQCDAVRNENSTTSSGLWPSLNGSMCSKSPRRASSPGRAGGYSRTASSPELHHHHRLDQQLAAEQLEVVPLVGDARRSFTLPAEFSRSHSMLF